MLGRFIFASLIAHTLILAALMHGRAAPPSWFTAPPLSISLDGEMPSTPGDTVTRVTSVKPAMIADTRVASTSAEADNTSLDDRAEIDTAAVADGAGDESRRANHLLAELQLAVDRYFQYPPLAFKHGWQGSVEVGVRLDPDGRVHVLALRRSSGFAVLDRDAVQTLERIDTLPHMRAWLDGRAYETRLTILYRIVET